MYMYIYYLIFIVLLWQLGRQRYLSIAFLHFRYADSSVHAAEGITIYSFLNLANSTAQM